MTNLSETELQEIEKRCERATPKPWHCGDGDLGGALVVYWLGERIANCTNSMPGHSRETKESNAEFIAHARTDIPALTATVRELQRQVQEREEALRPFALPPGWHFIAYNKTGSTGCPFNAGEVERVRAILAPKEQTP